MQKLKSLACITFLLGAAPLVVALVGQYGFDLYPCHLCIVQRYPYALIMALAVIIALIRHHPARVRFILALLIMVCVVEAGIAAYHVGVEQKWIMGPEGCTTGVSSGDQSLDALRAQIMGTAVVMCDNPTAIFLGISMAGWNIAYALVAASAFFILLRKHLRKEVSHAD